MIKIEPNKTYMLKKDGTLIDSGSYHPYINLLNAMPKKANSIRRKDKYFVRLKDLVWFKQHIEDQKIKQICSECYRKAYSNSKGKKETAMIKYDIEDFLKLEDYTNEEFLKIRTSDIKFPTGGDNGEIYFRVSSTQFNWFDLIWQVVIDNHQWIHSITIVRDITIGTKQEEYFIIDGHKTFQMCLNEFLTLPGNPVIK